MIVLVWTYYSSQILFFGAELIRAKYFDPVPVVPTEQAVPIDEIRIARQPVVADLVAPNSCDFAARGG